MMSSAKARMMVFGSLALSVNVSPLLLSTVTIITYHVYPVTSEEEMEQENLSQLLA